MLCEIRHFVFRVGELQGCAKPSVVFQNATGPHSTHLTPRSESWTPWHVFGACLLEFAGLRLVTEVHSPTWPALGLRWQCVCAVQSQVCQTVGHSLQLSRSRFQRS